MACNCKRAVQIENDYGVPTEETLIEKVLRGLYKCIVFIVIVALSIIACPIVIILVIYKMTFGSGGIRIPHKVFEMARNNE